jgi:hypothetical protein
MEQTARIIRTTRKTAEALSGEGVAATQAAGALTVVKEATAVGNGRGGARGTGNGDEGKK